MRVNPLPFVFAPGVALAGALVAGARGMWVALFAWTLLVALATFTAWLRRPRH